MTDTADNPDKPDDADRIAKVIARAGVASRREAERMILEGRVTVNGQKIDSPALDVQPTDRIVVDGKKLGEKQETRLWLYYKPVGLITSESDELGRQTVFDALPRDLPRVMSVGRLDLNSEGLLLLTNDGDLKRRLELPATGWLRRYRVRVNGTPSDMTFDPLRRGATIDGEEFATMEIKLDSQQGANAWLTVGIREGKNREIRRAMTHVGLQVNRLIRVGYGPFKLAGLEKNEVSEVKRKVLRDQLGGLLTGDVEDKPREMRPRGAQGGRPPRGGPGERPESRTFRSGGSDRLRRDDDDRSPRGFHGKPEGRGDRPSFADRPKRNFGDKPVGDRPKRSYGDKPTGDRPTRGFGEKPGGDRPRGGKPWDNGDRPRGPRAEGDPSDRPRRGFAGKPAEGGRPARPGEPWDKKPGDRHSADRKPWDGKPRSDRPRDGSGSGATRGDQPRHSFGGAKPAEGQGERRSFSPSGPGPQGGKPAGKPGFKGGRPGGGKPYGGKPGGGKPGSAKPNGGRPGGGRPSGKPRTS